MGLLDSLNKAAEEEKYAKELAASADSSDDSSESATKSKAPVYYSEVVNLGFNCEVSFRICGYFKTLHSYMYSWIYSHDRELLLDSFDKMHDILSGEVEFLPDTNMIRCKKFNMSFHIKARRDELANSLGSLRDDACKEPSRSSKRSRFLSASSTLVTLTLPAEDMLKTSRKRLAKTSSMHSSFLRASMSSSQKP